MSFMHRGDATGEWDELPATLVEGLTEAVNEYDAMLSTVRLELFARASDYLDRLIDPFDRNGKTMALVTGH
ncbi:MULTISPECIES: hypothetical protein [unclassified Paraburkholderia]|uniref:hypothetical protein n=1 Tax=unclassified Paraburkholderia TaxID=2615204 RepID=UPI002AB0BEB9|nr:MULTISPECIES: hypothetical protein [unclassified Paraburkholderia]